MEPRVAFERLLQALAPACRSVYGERLISVVVFGSVGRGTARADSDVDVLVVAEPLPRGRIRRVEEFEAVRTNLGPSLELARSSGLATRIAPIFKTPEEASRGSAVFLDMTEDARILFDRVGFFSGVLEALRARLSRLGARRVWKGESWYWDLKPDFKPGDVIEI